MKQTLKDSIVCPVCGQSNPPLGVRCISCGSQIQERQAALDLFGTLYGLLDAPLSTFHKIAISEQKNYVYLLFAAVGPLIMSGMLASAHIGNVAGNFAIVFLIVALAGPLAGIVFMTLLALAFFGVCKAGYARYATFRLASAMLAYALMPMVLYSVVILPIALAVMGIQLFSTNPAPWQYKPAVFWTLMGFLGIAAAWTIANFDCALRALRAGRWGVFMLLGLFAAAIYLLIIALPGAVSSSLIRLIVSI
jgi:hypothetical protein